MWSTQQKRAQQLGKGRSATVELNVSSCFFVADCGHPPSSYNRRERPLLRSALGLGSDEASWLDIKSDVQKVKNEVDLGHSLGNFFVCFFSAIFFWQKTEKRGQWRLGVNKKKSRSWMFWKSTWAFREMNIMNPRESLAKVKLFEWEIWKLS